ncbi:MAG: YfbM family protein [Proteobacteria bacterium]|nr:YfbM family protein [Pseudomonadota bacterium]
MACRGVHFALTTEDEQRLRACPLDDRARLISDEIEEQYFTHAADWLCETDKAWDAIHRAFNASELDYEYRSPLHGVILGGERLYEGEGYVISLKDPAAVREISPSLASVTRTAFRSLYYSIEPAKYGMSLSDQDLDYTWEWLERLKPFYERAANAGRAVIFTTDQ